VTTASVQRKFNFDESIFVCCEDLLDPGFRNSHGDLLTEIISIKSHHPAILSREPF